MIKDYNLIQELIRENGAESKADLINLALGKEVNTSIIETDYNKKTEASLEKFNKAEAKYKEELEKAEAKYKEELEIFNTSPTLNAKLAVGKQMKFVIFKLVEAGL